MGVVFIRNRGLSQAGFTVVELILVTVVIGVLAGIAIANFGNIRQSAINMAIKNDLKSATKAVKVESIRNRNTALAELPTSFKPSKDIIVHYSPTSSVKYGSLTPVQNGVLFWTVCEELVADSQFSTIHSKDGKATDSVVMSCNKNIRADGLLIEGWSSRSWLRPVQKAQLQAYIDSVPSDSWWIDKQAVVRSFHQELIDRFESRGGTFPITSFWDPWANAWSGVHKEELPAPLPGPTNNFCIEAYHQDDPATKFHITAQGDQLLPGGC